MQRTKSIITAAALCVWILGAPAAFALPPRPNDPGFNPADRFFQLVKRAVVKTLTELVVPKP